MTLRVPEANAFTEFMESLKGASVRVPQKLDRRAIAKENLKATPMTQRKFASNFKIKVVLEALMVGE